jgi:hypothetical protein
MFEFLGQVTGGITFEDVTIDSAILSDSGGLGVFFDIGGKKDTLTFKTFKIKSTTAGF